MTATNTDQPAGRHGPTTDGPSKAGVRDRRLRSRTSFDAVYVLVGAVGVWYLLSLLSFVVPTPLASVSALSENVLTATFRSAVAKTVRDGMVAFSLAALVGVVVGGAIGLSGSLRKYLEPAILSLNGVPKIATYPIFLLLFGLGSSSQVAMGFIFGVFPVVINFAGGSAGIPSVYVRLSKSLCMSGTARLTKLSIPAAMPSLAVGLRMGFSLSFVGVVFSEIIASKGGMGQLIISKYVLAQYDRMAAAVLLLVVISTLGTTAIWRAERRVTQRWRRGEV